MGTGIGHLWNSAPRPMRFLGADEVERRRKWDLKFLDLARHWAQNSKDPSTKTGAVIVRPNLSVASLGFNGFPIGVDDTLERLNDRQTKYRMIVHCEQNAILFARESLAGCTLYTWPFMSCAPCAASVIQSGIKRCVAPPIPAHLQERWGADMALSRQMFAEAGVQLDILELP